MSKSVVFLDNFFVFLEDTSELQTVLDRELFGRFFEVKEVFNLVAPFATLNETAIKSLPSTVALVSLKNDCAATNLNVYSLVDAGLFARNHQGLHNEFKSSEFRKVVSQGNCTVLVQRQCTVMPAHTNVCDAHLSYLGAADFYAFASIEVYDMNSL